jgi:predicted metalloprotease with PDZ domain
MSFAQDVKYKLKMPKPQDHYYHVEMELTDFGSGELDVVMPIWTPGSYLAREFAKNVNLVRAFDENGNILDVKKMDKNSWRIFKGNATKIRINYEVYAFELSVRTSFLDLSHGFVSGSGVFMFVRGFEKNPGELEIYPYFEFDVITTALKEKDEGIVRDGFKTYKYDSYDHLLDCPIEIGNQEVFTFEASGLEHTVSMYGFGNYDIARLQKDMANIVESSTNVFGQNPNKDYTFIIHNVANSQGGLEHTNSTVLSVNRWAYEGPKYIDFLKLVAHEYFHLWNVKRIRPIELGPFDYSNENYTSQLWVMEGFTSYYEKLILLRAGYYTEDEFLKKMFSSLNYIEGSTGARVQPVAHASFDAWIKAYRPNENSHNTTASYYSRGAVIAMMLDAKMIKKHNGKKGLDAFMQGLYEKYFKGQNRGFTEDEFKQELEHFLGENLDQFYNDYINGTKIPDYNAVFSEIGLLVEYIGKPKPSVGISMVETDGKTKVSRIRSGSAAEDAGISVNDELIGCNGIRINKNRLESYFKSVSVGEAINLLFSRDNLLYSKEIIVTEYEQPRFKYRIKTDRNNVKLFNFWLRKELD